MLSSPILTWDTRPSFLLRSPSRYDTLNVPRKRPNHPYSPKCLEEKLSEIHLLAAERRSVRRVVMSSCSHPSPVKERSSSSSESTSERFSPCSAMSA